MANTAMIPITTLLQNGITMFCPPDIAIGTFLASLPDFDVDYLADRVQTIFIDGNAIDNLDKPFPGKSHVIALSAAMPGLAGAIFRRNSICAALRKNSGQEIEEKVKQKEAIEISLKLFNVIAQEKGPALLRHGGIFSGKALWDFFNLRKSLIDQIFTFSINGDEGKGNDLMQCLKPHNLYETIIAPVSGTTT